MNVISPVDTDEVQTILPDEHQSPLISTLEKREEVEETNIETIIPITTTDTNTESIDELKSSTVPIEESIKPTVSSTTSVSNQPENESPVIEVPISKLPAENPLAKLISTMLPDAAPFIPSPIMTDNQAVTPIPISTMNNDAPAFIPSQQPMINTGGGQWNGNNTRGGGGVGNRRGQNAVS